MPLIYELYTKILLTAYYIKIIVKLKKVNVCIFMIDSLRYSFAIESNA